MESLIHSARVVASSALAHGPEHKLPDSGGERLVDAPPVVFFDLVETLLAVLAACHRALTDWGRATDAAPISRTTIRAALSFGEDEFLSVLLPHEDRAVHRHVLDNIEAEYVKDPAVHCGMPQLLAWLAPQAVLCILTNTRTERAERALYVAGLLNYFTARDGERRVFGSANKPEVEVLLGAMEDLGCRREGTLLIGDSHADVKSAERADITSIRVWWDRDRASAQDEMAADVVRTPQELLVRLGTWMREGRGAAQACAL